MAFYQVFYPHFSCFPPSFILWIASLQFVWEKIGPPIESANCHAIIAKRQAWTMLTGNGAYTYTLEEHFYVSFCIMVGGFLQARGTRKFAQIEQLRGEGGVLWVRTGGGRGWVGRWLGSFRV